MGAHVWPPLWLTNSDIRLVVCTAWVMWHQSDLQNSRGGAINHIGSGINHCVEDIFCRRCPLTITLHKTLAPTLLGRTLLLLHHSISHKSDHRLVSRKREERDVLSTTHLKCRLKFIELPACQTSQMLFRSESKRQWRLCFFEINLKTTFYFTAVTPTAPPLW